MARIRTISPDFFTSEDIVSMTPLARLFYVSLWCEADRAGRFEWRPGTLKMRYLPGDNCKIESLAKELLDRGLIVIYSIDGRQFAAIPDFAQHQVINNRETESVISPPVDACVTRESGVKAACEVIEMPLESRRTGSRVRKEGPPTADTWREYAEAYSNRYNTDPVRNATTNTQMSNFVKRIGEMEAPSVAAWFVGHQNRFYVESGHSVGILMRDAEKLRTEWATGRRGTASQAMQADKTQTNANSFGKLILEAQKKESENV